MERKCDVLINAHEVRSQSLGETYEFILNHQLQIAEWIKLTEREERITFPFQDPTLYLKGKLFELNHVRIDPSLDNTWAIRQLIRALRQVGVWVFKQSDAEDFEYEEAPGEISDNVRFYLNAEGKLIFLSPAMRPKLIHCN